MSATAMSPTAAGLDCIPSSWELLDSYGGQRTTYAQVWRPACVPQLQQLFAHARHERRRVTLRAGGHSFDDQALGDDVVVSMMGFDGIDLLGGGLVMVGAGATWGAILEKLKRHALLPAVTVTTEHATAGGTLAGDCLSRFSCALGRQGAWIERFTLVTPQGEELDCARPANPNAPATLQEQVFMGAIGGLGYLGAVVSITFQALPVPGRGRIRVLTTVRKLETFRHLADHLVERAKEIPPPGSGRVKPVALYAALHSGPSGPRQALAFESRFTTRRAGGHPMLLFLPGFRLRVLVEWLVRLVPFNRLLWGVAFEVFYKDGGKYVDSLAGFTFFMDANARARRVAQRLGFNPQTLEQTFILPADPRSEETWAEAREHLVSWLEDANALFCELELTPTLDDVLFLPADLRFDLSSTADMAGFAVSYSFETSDRKRIAKAERAFVQLADTLWSDYEGRVHLVKNVRARPATLVSMYGSGAVEFFQLKATVDPDCILRNAWLERTFGPLLPAACR
ncbi:MAG: decaprenylphospho-beta-D-ribofuranose 2-oxidase [Solirubrobacteraceae bacterium]|nr:decaprenylphospho-beta-D-ribofuranose 2-oxidase [Solirubrobacteraceae bacterium]